MLKSESLINLVNSLSRQEKRDFSIKTSDAALRDYAVLFHLINSKGISDSVDLKREFEIQRPGSSFNTAVTYLFNRLTGYLVSLRKRQDSYFMLFEEILNARVLYEKSLYNESLEILQRVKRQAAHYDNAMALLIAQRLELDYLLTIDFKGLDEEQLLAKQSRLRNTMRGITKLNEHCALYELLRQRTLRYGNSRSSEDIRKFDDLVTSEISIMSSMTQESFEIQKNHWLFQANYFITAGDYRAAFNSFVELNHLFEENRHLWNTPPVYYLMVMEGMLESLRIIRNYNGIEYFISKLETLKSDSFSFQLSVNYTIFIYRLASLTDTGQFTKAVKLIDEYQQSLIDKSGMLKSVQQLELTLSCAVAYLGVGDFKRARRKIRPLLTGMSYNSSPQFRTLRIVNIMIYYEMGDYDYVASESRSIKRDINKDRKHKLKTEQLILNFINSYPVGVHRRQRDEVWKRIKNKINALYNDKYEIQLMRKFDFFAWVESKIFDRPLSDVIKDPAYQLPIEKRYRP